MGGRLPYLVLPTNEKNDAGLYGENTYLGPLANAKNGGAGLYMERICLVSEVNFITSLSDYKNLCSKIIFVNTSIFAFTKILLSEDTAPLGWFHYWIGIKNNHF